jgi:hypothetical protein
MHIANSNSMILSTLNFAGVEIRDIDLVESSSFPDGLPGAVGRFDDEDHGMPTLLGSAEGARSELIAASTELTEGVALLGRDNVDDVLIGTPFADRFYGEQSDLAQTIDAVSYERSDQGVIVDLVAGAGENGHADGDRYFGIENVVGSEFGDEIHGDVEENVIEGSLGHDDLLGDEGNDLLYGSFDPEGGNQGEFNPEDDGADYLNGGDGDDMLFGGFGPDMLVSYDGEDIVDGGPGNDVLDGSGTVLFREGSGHDVVYSLGTVHFENVDLGDVSLLWDFDEFEEESPSRSYGIVREGDAALQIGDDSIFFGQLWWGGSADRPKQQLHGSPALPRRARQRNGADRPLHGIRGGVRSRFGHGLDHPLLLQLRSR